MKKYLHFLCLLIEVSNFCGLIYATENTIHKIADKRIKHGTNETLFAMTKGMQVTECSPL